MRDDRLITGSVVIQWSNEYYTGLAPGVSLISQEDWEKLKGSMSEEDYIKSIGLEKFDLVPVLSP